MATALRRYGTMFGVVLVFRDVTEQRKAQQTASRLAAVVEHSGDAIFTKNLDGVIQTWNPSAERLFGYRAEEIVGKSVTVLFPPDRLNEEDHIIGRLRQGQPIGRLETIRVVSACHQHANCPGLLRATDPDISKRTWQFVMNEIVKLKHGETQRRWTVAIKDKAFTNLRDMPLLRTRAEHLLNALHAGSVATNVYLRRIHN